MKCRNYSDLIAWQKAMDLASAIYEVTNSFPREERYGLSSQLRRAGVSVPSNIAEGQGRGSKAEFGHHLSIAHGSIREIETQILISSRLGYLRQEERKRVLNLAAEVGRLVKGLSNSLRST